MTELAAMEHAGGVGTDARGSIALPEPQEAGMSAELTTEVVSDLEGIAALEPDYECGWPSAEERVTKPPALELTGALPRLTCGDLPARPPVGFWGNG